MKRLPLLLLLALSFTAGAQNSAPVVTMNGIGDFRIGMKKAEVEKLIGQPLKLVNLIKKAEEWNRDTIDLVYKDVQYQLILDKDYINDKREDIILYEIKTNSPNLKTKSGVGIGDDKFKIVGTYGDYMLQIQPDYEQDFTVKSKTKSTVWLFGDEDKVIIFYLTNNKVTGFSVMFNEGC
jgi:hypothetical protein